ncbi:hypothetical protein KKF84_20200, partial [Myxococcota bacterium]|nr:hypothetical protein [Myxococcota bacterium]
LHITDAQHATLVTHDPWPYELGGFCNRTLVAADKMVCATWDGTATRVSAVDMRDSTEIVSWEELTIPGQVYEMHMTPEGALIQLFSTPAETGDLPDTLYGVRFTGDGTPQVLGPVVLPGSELVQFENGYKSWHSTFLTLDATHTGIRFSGYDATGYQGGILPISFDASALTLLPTLKTNGRPEHHVAGEGDLIVWTGDHAEFFQDYLAPDPAPALRSASAHSVLRAVPWADTQVALLLTDLWDRTAKIGIYEASDTHLDAPVAMVDLADIIPEESPCYGYWTQGMGYSRAVLLGDAPYLYLLWSETHPDHYGSALPDGAEYEPTHLLVLDLSDETSPWIVSHTTFPTGFAYQPGWFIGGSIPARLGPELVQNGHLILFKPYPFSHYEEHGVPHSSLALLDVSDPAHPQLSTYSPDEGVVVSPLHSGGGQFYATISQPVSQTQTAFYLARWGNGASPLVASHEPVNIPGLAVHYDATTSELITLDYQTLETQTPDAESCFANGLHCSYGTSCVCQTRLLRRSSLSDAGALIEHTYSFDGYFIHDVYVTDTRIVVLVQVIEWWFTAMGEPLPEHFMAIGTKPRGTPDSEAFSFTPITTLFTYTGPIIFADEHLVYLHDNENQTTFVVDTDENSTAHTDLFRDYSPLTQVRESRGGTLYFPGHWNGFSRWSQQQ